MRPIDADALIISDEECVNTICRDCKMQVNGCEDFFNIIKNASTIELERPKGKWVPHSEKSREYIGTVLINVVYDYWFCDACGYQVEKGEPMYNFCPNCGADMRGGET